MPTLYRCLLYLYPAVYRHMYAEEMISVFRQAQEAVETAGFKACASFYVREFPGLLCGALQEHLRSVAGPYDWFPFRRFDMRPEFRFPRSTVLLMAVILAAVALAIEKAKNVQLHYTESPNVVSMWPALPWFLASVFLIVSATAIIVWGVLFALRRTGAHRLAALDPWSEQ